MGGVLKKHQWVGIAESEGVLISAEKLNSAQTIQSLRRLLGRLKCCHYEGLEPGCAYKIMAQLKMDQTISIKVIEQMEKNNG